MLPPTALHFEPGLLPRVSAKTSRFRGVHWCSSKGLWRAEIEMTGRKYKLGRFLTEHEAARAYDAAAIKHNVPERCNAWWAYTVEISQRHKRRHGKTAMRRARA